MAWFRVPLACARAFAEGHEEAFYELEDDTTAVVSISRVDAMSGPGRSTIALVVAVDAPDAATAAGLARALLVAAPDVEVLSLGEVTETTNPRAPSGEVLGILRDAADELREELREDIALLRDGLAYEDTFAVSEHLPAVYARHYTPEVVTQWAASVEAVAHKLAGYPGTYLASTAEELAGHALIACCEALIDEREDDLEDPDAAREKFSEMHDLAFEDHDVLLLFDARFDGIEDSDVGERMDMANLHVRDWFKPFRSDH